MESLRKKNNTAAMERTQAAYRKFLLALCREQVGPDLRVAEVGRHEPPEARRRRRGGGRSSTQMLKVYGEDTQFLAKPQGPQRILLVKIRLVSALRA